VWVEVSQTGVAPEHVVLVVHVAPQVCPLEQFGVFVGQSALDRQSTQMCIAT
jgi:hypothetical protein